MYPISATELDWFVCFDAPASELMPTEASKIKERALHVVQGWNWGVEQAVLCTPLEECRWSFLSDRWEVPPLVQKKTPFHGKATLVGDALHPMTPNLGQGGCTALEDGVILARCVAAAGARALEREAMGAAFKEYERQRAMRCLPLTVRSRLMGAALQLPWSPVVGVRDMFVSTLFNASHFLDHAEFDCGDLSDLGLDENLTVKL
jgi:2-polyprenyl-6-methoxyphenol hydroxylase-like FAD-dependent oxidoreductase